MMLKTTKISALITGVLMIIGMIFKTQHWLGAHFIFISGLIIGTFTAVLIIALFLKKPSPFLEKLNVIFTSSVIIIVLIGFLFKLMHWPGAEKLIWVADLGILISTLLLMIDVVREKDSTKAMLKIITLFFLLFLLVLIMISSF